MIATIEKLYKAKEKLAEMKFRLENSPFDTERDSTLGFFSLEEINLFERLVTDYIGEAEETMMLEYGTNN